MQDKLEKVSKIYKIMVMSFLLPVFFMLIKMNTPDSDMYFLATTGKYIVENKTVPSINPFTIHEGFQAIFQQPIVDIINYYLYSRFGNLGLYIYAITFFFIAMVCIYQYMSLYTDNFDMKRYILFPCGFILYLFSNTRPTSISFLILLIELYVLEKYERTKEKKYIWILPLLSLIEINCHEALWPMLFVMIMPRLLPEKISVPFNIKRLVLLLKEKITYIYICFIMFLIGFINPNGWNGMTYIFQSYGNVKNASIAELEAETFFSIYGIFCILAIILLTLYINEKKINSNIQLLALSVGCFILAIMHIRNLWFLILGELPVICLYLDKFKKSTKYKYSVREYQFMNCFYAVLIIITCIVMSGIDYSTYGTTDNAIRPEKAVEYLNHKEDVILYNGFNNGAYLEWNGYQTYIDARPELYQKQINKKEDIFTEYMNIRKGNIDYQEFVDKYQFTHILVAEETPFRNWLKYESNYKCVIESDEYDLYERITEK